VLAFLPNDAKRLPGVIAEATSAARARPLVFAYQGQTPRRGNPRLLEILDPYADDEQAHDAFQQAEAAARKGRTQARYVYAPAGGEPDFEDRLREQLNPEQVIGSA
jgi:hypothetical protein